MQRARQFSSRFKDRYNNSVRSFRELTPIQQRNFCERSCLCVLIFVSVPLFFGLLFGFMWPEVRRAGFTQTTCTITSVDVLYHYECWKSCSCDSTDLEKTCDSVIGYDQSLDPKKCLSDSGSSNVTKSQCPIENESCNGGYKCCSRRCTTINKVTTCLCSSSVSNSFCVVNCQVKYTGALNVKLKENAAIILQDFQTDLTAATEFTQFYNTKHTFTCYHNPLNGRPLAVNEVVLSRDYTEWKIAIFVIFGVFPFFLCVVMLIVVIVHCFEKDEYGDKPNGRDVGEKVDEPGRFPNELNLT